MAAPMSAEDKLRSSFTAAAGIKKGDDGQLKVAQSDVKRAPTGEQILEKAVEETKKVSLDSTPTKSATTTRSSLASISKVIPKASPAKTVGDKTPPTRQSIGGGAAGTAGASRLTANKTAKQLELTAKKEEMERQRKLRQTAAGVKPGLTRQSTTAAGTASGATSARGTTGRTSARPGATGTTAATGTRMTLAQRQEAAK